MTPAQTGRAAMLLTALSGFNALIKESNKKKPPKYGDGRAVEVAIAEMNDGEGQGSNAYIYLDLETGKKLLPKVRDLIRTELIALGVEP